VRTSRAVRKPGAACRPFTRRPLRAGGLENAAEVESLTALLINLAANNEGLHDLGVRFT